MHLGMYLNEQFQSVLVVSLLTASAPMKLQESTDADRSMVDITVTSKGIEKLLFNLNPHKAADPDQIKPIILKNILTPLSPILKHLFQKEPYHQTGRMLRWRLSTKKVNTLTLPTTGPYPLLVFVVKH